MREGDLASIPVDQLDPEALELHREAVVIDSHVDTALKLEQGKRTLHLAGGKGQVDLKKLRDGGVDILFFAHYIRPEYKPHLALVQLLTLLDRTLEQVDDSQFTLITNAQEARKARAAGQIGLYLTIEGGEVLHENLEVLRILCRLGFRSLSLTWNQRNQLADGVSEGEAAGGLSLRGREVVREMFRLGMLVDVSHLSPKAFWDVMEEAQPGRVIASHANARVLCSHPRNLDDEQIRALADSGGVMGITFAPYFLAETDPSVISVLDHLDYVASLVGTDHLGLGSDFDGISWSPRGLSDISFMPRITAGLLGRGWSRQDIRKVLGENYLKLMA